MASGVILGFSSPALKKLFGAKWIAKKESNEIKKSITTI
jgi:hypothetical protein